MKQLDVFCKGTTFFIFKLCEKCPNTEIFLVRTECGDLLSKFCSPNTGKYGPEKAPYLDTFDAVHSFLSISTIK